MTDSQISTFPVPDLDDIPEDLRSMMMGIQEKTGFIPNVFLGLAHRPEEPATARAVNRHHRREHRAGDGVADVHRVGKRAIHARLYQRERRV